jgi:CDP-glucose 4,6-dehydratase
LVTGGSGFGGSHLCAELISLKARVFIYDRHCPRDSYLVLEGLDRRVDFVTGDIRDLGFLNLTLQRLQIDTVFHLAAQPIVPISNLLPFETFQINAMGTCAVLEAVRLAPSKPDLIIASSAAYYGRTVSDEPIPEDHEPRRFTNVYSASKVATDVLARCYAQTFGVRAASCRFMNTYGPGDTNFSRIVPRAI